MTVKNKVILITLLFAVPAFLTGRMIWPPDPMGPAPTSAQLPFLMIVSLVESISFGLGVAFLVLGWPWMKKLSGKGDRLIFWSYISIAWLLINWWPHDNLHIHNGMNIDGLIRIEYGFHVTLITAAIIVAFFFIRNFSKFSKS